MSCKHALERFENILGGHTDEPLDLASNSSSSSNASYLEHFLSLEGLWTHLSPYRRNRWSVIAARENPPKSPCFH